MTGLAPLRPLRFFVWKVKTDGIEMVGQEPIFRFFDIKPIFFYHIGLVFHIWIDFVDGFFF